MKIQAINNNQTQYKSKTNFRGNLILPEKLSENSKKIIKRSVEQITKLIEEKPYDVYVKEVETKEKETQPIVFIVKETNEKTNLPKEAVINAISVLIEEPKTNKEEVLELKMPPVSIKEISEQLPFLRHKQTKSKYYVPKTIGKPQKPYIKKH